MNELFLKLPALGYIIYESDSPAIFAQKMNEILDMRILPNQDPEECARQWLEKINANEIIS